MTHFQIVGMAYVKSDEHAVGERQQQQRKHLLGRVGDWRDTLALYGNIRYTIRFVAPFEGLMMVHCHIQKHAEYGMAALAQITRD